MCEQEINTSGGWKLGGVDKRGEKVQPSSYEMNKPWGHNVQHGDDMKRSWAVCVKVAETADLRSPRHKGKLC